MKALAAEKADRRCRFAARRSAVFTQASTAAGVGAGLRCGVAHPPVLAFGNDRFVRVHTPAMLDVAPVVVVAHQCAPVPTDVACEFGNASHCFCTSRSALVVMSPDGANSRDGTGSSSERGDPAPRIALSATITPAAKTMMVRTAKTIDSVP